MFKQIFKTIYKDKVGSVLTIITNEYSENNMYPLSLVIDGITFKGCSFDDFELVDSEIYTEDQLKRFTLNKVPVYNTNEFVFELCNCSLQIEIPIQLINIRLNNEVNTLLKLNLELGKPSANGGIEYEIGEFRLSYKGKEYFAKADMFEDAMDELKNQIGDDYAFSNCFGCMYGDYSPYGNGFFGTMQCFKSHKKEYLSVRSKKEILDLADKGFIVVQEIYCCNDFEIRKPGIGYR